MEPHEALEELKTILVTRLKFKPARAAELTMETTLPKGIEGSLGFDSLDFIELSLALEERFGMVIDDPEDLTPHFQSLDTLSRFICVKAHGG
jgi:acyl carrier protein